MRRRIALVMCLFVIGLFCGAPTYYDLCPDSISDSPDEYATITTDNSTHAYIKEINGERVGSGIRNVEVYVPPGVVIITGLYNDGENYTSATCPGEFTVEGGHTYLFTGEIGKKTTYGGGGNELYFYLNDLDTGEVMKETPVTSYEEEITDEVE
ncbi:MAG: hypothetical protein JW885_09185 [Deltaproteobacteria bacterium]|nr:hypothetical protein [Candidatus Zymogenaceae bacterium]